MLPHPRAPERHDIRAMPDVDVSARLVTLAVRRVRLEESICGAWLIRAAFGALRQAATSSSVRQRDRRTVADRAPSAAAYAEARGSRRKARGRQVRMA